MDFWHIPKHGKCREQRKYDHRNHSGGYGGKRFEKCDISLTPHEREKDRGKNRNRHIGDYGECGKPRDTAAKHSGDHRSGCGCRTEYTYERTLGKLTIEREQREICQYRSENLYKYQSPLEARDAKFMWLDLAERYEEHYEYQIRCHKGYHFYKVMKQYAAKHSYRQHPRFEPLSDQSRIHCIGNLVQN